MGRVGLDAGNTDGRGPREVVRGAVGCGTRWESEGDDRVRDLFAGAVWRWVT